jgi:hypothetical protein
MFNCFLDNSIYTNVGMHNIKKIKWEWRLMFTHLCPRNQKDLNNEPFLFELQSNGPQSR